MRKRFLMIIFIALIASLTNPLFSNESQNKNSQDIIKPSVDDRQIKLASPDANARAFAEKEKWILHGMREHCFSSALPLFYRINNRYPVDVKELIDSGYLLAWPADPSSGKPLRLVDKVKPVKDDLGKIAYIRTSDSNAHFEIVDYNDAENDYAIRELPYPPAGQSLLSKLQDNNSPAKAIEGVFMANMTDLIGIAMHKPEYRFGEKHFDSFDKAVEGNYFLIKENIKPSFISADSSIPFFLEIGVASLDGREVEFFEATFRSTTPTGREYIRHMTWEEPLMDSLDIKYNDEEAVNRMTGKQYLYSTRMLLDGSLNIPQKALISKKEILNME